jgi:hypothetical protein
MANYLTAEDEQNYGRDLIDVAQRAAMQTVAPHLQNLEQQNAQLRRDVAKEARHRMDAAVEKEIPNYREIDKNPRWHRWLLGIDPLSSRVRQTLLNAAISAGNASRVIAFFQQFQREDAGASQQTYSPTSNRQSAKPIYSPTQIKQLYEQHRKGLWSGREAEWARLEADFCAASGEGRVQMQPYLTK